MKQLSVHHGFTLLEVMVVLFLMAMLSAVTAVTLQSSLANATERDVIEGLNHFDRSVRQEAQMFGQSISVEVDLEKDRLRRTIKDEYGRDRTEVYIVPKPFNLRRVQINGMRASVSSWSCNVDGHTPTYALTLIGPEKKTTGNASFVLVFAGLTGQMTRVDDTDAAEALLAELQKE